MVALSASISACNFKDYALGTEAETMTPDLRAPRDPSFKGVGEAVALCEEFF